MKKMKVISFIAICMVGVLFLYRHVQSGKEIITESVQTAQNVEFPENYQKKVSESFEFDVEVIVPEDVDVNNLYWGTAVDAPLDRDKIYQHFFGNSQEVKQEKSEGDSTSLDRQGKDCSWETDEDENGNYMLLEENTHLAYEKDLEMFYVSNCINFDTRGGVDNLAVYAETTNLEFMNQEAAKAEMEKDLSEMGIETDGNLCTVYALDLENLKEQEILAYQDENIEAKEMNPSWEKEQEGYYFFMNQTFQGLPVYSENGVSSGVWDNPAESPLQVYYTEHGIYGCDIINYFQMEQGKDKVALVPFEKIIATLEEKYGNVINTNKLVVKRMELMEYPVYKKDGVYQMMPIWVCYLQTLDENGENPDTLYIKVPIHADTGEEALEIES